MKDGSSVPLKSCHCGAAHETGPYIPLSGELPSLSQLILSLQKVGWKSREAHTTSSLESPNSCISPYVRDQWPGHFITAHHACPLSCPHIYQGCSSCPD